jgi:hypothetical protein
VQKRRYAIWSALAILASLIWVASTCDGIAESLDSDRRPDRTEQGLQQPSQQELPIRSPISRQQIEDGEPSDGLAPPYPAGLAEVFRKAFLNYYSSPEGFITSENYERRMQEQWWNSPTETWLRRCLRLYSELSKHEGFTDYSDGLTFTDGLLMGEAEGANLIHRQRIWAVNFLSRAEADGLTKIEDLIDPRNLVQSPFNYPAEFLIWHIHGSIILPLPAEIQSSLVVIRESALDVWVSYTQSIAYIEPSLRAAQRELGIEFQIEPAAWQTLIPEYAAIFEGIRDTELGYCYDLTGLVRRSGLAVLNPIP